MGAGKNLSCDLIHRSKEHPCFIVSSTQESNVVASHTLVGSRLQQFTQEDRES